VVQIRFGGWLVGFSPIVLLVQRFSNCGAPPSAVALVVLGGGMRFVSMRDIYFERNMGAR
jgi:hypothetical protein